MTFFNCQKIRAPRNRTIELTTEETDIYRKNLIGAEDDLQNCRNRTICGDAFEILEKLPAANFRFAVSPIRRII